MVQLPSARTWFDKSLEVPPRECELKAGLTFEWDKSIP
jgi:hypothetical protein